MLLFLFHIWFSMLQFITAPVFWWMTYFNTDFQLHNSCPNYWSFSMVTVLHVWFLAQPFKGKLFTDIGFYICWNSWGFGWKMLTDCCTNLRRNLSPSALSYFLSAEVQGFLFYYITRMNFVYCSNMKKHKYCIWGACWVFPTLTLGGAHMLVMISPAAAK